MKDFLGFIFIFTLSYFAITYGISYLNGNIVTDQERTFLEEVVSLKQQCEVTLPRTQQCVLQYIPEQQ